MAGGSINTEMFMNHLRCDKSAYLFANEERLDPLKTSQKSLEIEGYKNFIFSIICNEEWYSDTEIIQNKLFVIGEILNNIKMIYKNSILEQVRKFLIM